MEMKIGINGTGDLSRIDQVAKAAAKAEEEGFDSFWIAQIFGVDALTTLALVGQRVPRIELGTAVVPTYPRHPMMLASQALTVQQATGNRLALGIGLSHQIVVESMWGYSYARPVRHMREYLAALLPMLKGEAASVSGEEVFSQGSVDVADATAPPVVVAALGSQMLKVAGSVGCGTITWCTGEKALVDHVVPGITRAAEDAGHPRPRVVAGLPICVTDDPAAAKAVVAEQLALYGGLPSYRAMLDLDQAGGPEDVAIIGNEAQVTSALQRLSDGGVTDFAAVIAAPNNDDRDATRALLRSLL
ncbi:MAG: TIGR03564 family F420-dependent LLM class oxidoreductase [Microthrixaceae bacterium]